MFPLSPPRPLLPTITISRSYKGLNSSTPQTISDYKLLSTSAGGTGFAGQCKGNRNLCTAQVLPLTTEASLKPTSSGIITSFRYSKGAALTPGQQEAPSDKVPPQKKLCISCCKRTHICRCLQFREIIFFPFSRHIC